MAKKGQKSFNEIMQERQERRVNLAKERNSRVLIVRSNDTHDMLNIMISIDKSIRRLRDGAGMQYEFDKAKEFIEEYKDLLVKTNDFAKRISKLTKIKYRVPDFLKTDDEKAKEAENKAKETKETKESENNAKNFKIKTGVKDGSVEFAEGIEV